MANRVEHLEELGFDLEIPARNTRRWKRWKQHNRKSLRERLIDRLSDSSLDEEGVYKVIREEFSAHDMKGVWAQEPFALTPCYECHNLTNTLYRNHRANRRETDWVCASCVSD